MNLLLQRQLRKHLDGRPLDDSQLCAFLDAVAKTYDEQEQDKKFISHTLEVASLELTEANERLRREAESQVRRISDFFQQTLDQQPNIIFRCKKVGSGFQMTLVRGSLLQRLGLKAEQVENHDVETLVADSAKQIFFERAWQGAAQVFELNLASSPLVFQVLLHPLKTDGQVSELIGIISDISVQKAAEARLRQTSDDLARRAQELEQNRRAMLSMIEDLDQSHKSITRERDRANALAQEAAAASRAKSDFLATMSHEIRTPMNGVLGMTELLLKTKLNARQKEFAEAVAQSANALLHVIDDVLDFSKIEAGKLAIVSEEFNLRNLIDAVLEVVSHRDLSKQIGLAAIVHHAVPARLHSDPQRLRQVLLNLVGNAVKFTDQGEVTLRVNVLAEAEGKLRLRFEIKDTGIGLAEEQIKHLFQPFVQTDQTASRRFGGTGLGLAISRKLVELMGGKIGAQSEAGQGSTFWCELPFTAATAAPVHQSHPALAFTQALIGVHQPALAESLHEQFRSWKISCEEVRTVQELLEKTEAAIAKKQTLLVLCDDELIADGGESFTEKIGQLKEAAHFILLASPAVAATHDERTLDLFKNVLLKPAKQSHLFDAMVSAVEGKDPQTARQKGTSDTFRRQNSSELSKNLAQLRILLAEDHLINRKLCLLMLEELGTQADVAENGAEVTAAIAEKQYDLILMDCNMPVMDGYEATKYIRQQERGQRHSRHMPIIALTANALIGERERCLAAGMDDYLAKPFTVAELRDAMLRATGEKTAPQAVTKHIRRLDQLVEELDRDSVAEMVRDFIQELPSRITELEKFLAGENYEEVERTAHSLKGVSASFGLSDLSAQFLATETAAEAGDLAVVKGLLPAVRLAADGAMIDLHAWLVKTPN